MYIYNILETIMKNPIEIIKVTYCHFFILISLECHLPKDFDLEFIPWHTLIRVEAQFTCNFAERL